MTFRAHRTIERIGPQKCIFGPRPINAGAPNSLTTKPRESSLAASHVAAICIDKYFHASSAILRFVNARTYRSSAHGGKHGNVQVSRRWTTMRPDEFYWTTHDDAAWTLAGEIIFIVSWCAWYADVNWLLEAATANGSATSIKRSDNMNHGSSQNNNKI